MSNIPASNWILKKEYFEAKLVDDFESRYREWFEKENGTTDSLDLNRFMLYLSEDSTVELYQFPNERSGLEHDYFEKDDDNHVIPRFLFEPVTSK
jgi:hypothetical protein